MAKEKTYTMLCLGDSYTIGESVEEEDRFPNQTVALLIKKNIHFEKPKIIATTGWTTGELISAIEREKIDSSFDFVTLLIGVNNQYRGRSAEEYRNQFKQLLSLSIHFSGNQKNHVIVLSIPDWGSTPFAEGRDRKQIAVEIDLFNSINKEESLNDGVHYIEITSLTREHADWVTEDRLHPNKKMYELWAQKIARIMEAETK